MLGSQKDVECRSVIYQLGIIAIQFRGNSLCAWQGGSVEVGRNMVCFDELMN